MSTERPCFYIRFTLEVICPFIAPASWMPLERFSKDGCTTGKTVCLWNSTLKWANSNNEAWSSSEIGIRPLVCPSGRPWKAEDKNHRASVTWARHRAKSSMKFTLAQTNGSAFLFYISSEKCHLWLQCAPSGICSLLNCIETISPLREHLETMVWLCST